jgi:putative transposase
MIESFWSRMQVELLDRRRWAHPDRTGQRDLDYLEIWHNRGRRHSSIGMLTSIE